MIISSFHSLTPRSYYVQGKTFQNFPRLPLLKGLISWPDNDKADAKKINKNEVVGAANHLNSVSVSSKT